MANPVVNQGILNRIKANVTWTDFPGLNVTAPFLDKPGISLRQNGPATLSHPTMTGVVKSPEPYVPVTLTIALLRTQSLASAYQLQYQDNTVLGDATVYPDVQSGGIAPYNLLNMSIDEIGDLLLNGTDPIYGITASGYWVVNNSLFD